MTDEEISRRDFVSKAALAASAAALAAGSAAAADGPPPQLPTLGLSQVSNKFPLMSATPKVITESGQITVANEDNFPILKGNEAAVFMVKMKAGAVREPHWHPNCWELNVVISGRAKVGVVNPDDTWSECEIGTGEVSFIPMGFFHYIEALEDLTIAVVFNNSLPQDIGLSTCFAGMPTKVFSNTFGKSMSGFPKASKTLFLVPGTAGS